MARIVGGLSGGRLLAGCDSSRFSVSILADGSRLMFYTECRTSTEPTWTDGTRRRYARWSHAAWILSSKLSSLQIRTENTIRFHQSARDTLQILPLFRMIISITGALCHLN